MGLLLFELETAKARETLSDKYLTPLCLKGLTVTLDTMSTNASSALHSSPLSVHKVFSFIMDSVF